MLSSHKKLDPKIRFIGGICSTREECVIHQVQQIISIIPIDIYICVCVCKTAAVGGGGCLSKVSSNTNWHFYDFRQVIYTCHDKMI